MLRVSTTRERKAKRAAAAAAGQPREKRTRGGSLTSRHVIDKEQKKRDELYNPKLRFFLPTPCEHEKNKGRCTEEVCAYGVRCSATDCIQRYCDDEYKPSWMSPAIPEDERCVVVRECEDGMEVGHGAKVNIQTTTYNVMNEIKTCSPAHTIVGAMAQCGETKATMGPILRATAAEMEELERNGLMVCDQCDRSDRKRRREAADCGSCKRVKVKVFQGSDQKAQGIQDTLCGNSGLFPCFACTCHRDGMHLWPEEVKERRPSAQKQRDLGLLGGPRSMEYALDAEPRLREFAMTATIFRAMRAHTTPLVQKLGEAKPARKFDAELLKQALRARRIKPERLKADQVRSLLGLFARSLARTGSLL